MKGLNIPKHDLKGVKIKICTIREVMTALFMTTVVKGTANLKTHSKYMNVVVKPVMGYLDHIAMARSYGILTPGRGKIDVCLKNHSEKQISLPKWTAVAEITTANNILVLLVPKPTGEESGKGEATTKKRKYMKVKKNCCTKLT